jgi:hypothetical protein
MVLAHAPLLSQLEPWLIIAAGLVGVAWLNKRGHTGDALNSLQTANKILHDDKAELRRRNAELIAENAALHNKTDFAAALTPLKVEIENHERRAEERSQKLIVILDLIAERLGNEANMDGT